MCRHRKVKNSKRATACNYCGNMVTQDEKNINDGACFFCNHRNDKIIHVKDVRCAKDSRICMVMVEPTGLKKMMQRIKDFLARYL